MFKGICFLASDGGLLLELCDSKAACCLFEQLPVQDGAPLCNSKRLAGQTLLEHISAEHGHCSREGCLGVLKAPAVINHGRVIPYLRCSAKVQSKKDAKSDSPSSSSQCAQGEHRAASCATACSALQTESSIPLHGEGGPAQPPCSAGVVDVPAVTAAQTPHQATLRLAVAMAFLSLAYCLVEGTVSVTLAAMDKYISLMIFGLDSFIEVASATLVLWRLMGRPIDLKRERAAVLTIGILLVLLACAATSASIFALVKHEHPETAAFALAISSISFVFLTITWLFKRRLAKRLNSAVLAADATCSFACARLSLVLLGGSLIYLVDPRVWWVDAATALLLSAFFLKEGVDMARSAMSSSFSGGCGCG